MPQPNDMNLTPDGAEFVCAWEGGIKTRAYQCSKFKDTIGVGHANSRFTIRGMVDGKTYEGKDVLPGLTISREEGERIFRMDLPYYENLVRRAVRVPVTQPMFDMLVDLAFNIPVAMQEGSDILAALNGGFDDDGHYIGPNDFGRAHRELLRWKDVPASPGVYRRRLSAACFVAGKPWRWILDTDKSEIGLHTTFPEILTIADRKPPEQPNPHYVIALNVPGGPVVEPSQPAEPAPKPVAVESTPKPAPAPAPVETKPMTEQSPKPAPPISVPYGSVDPTAEPKDMIKSKRFWGLMLIVVSRFSMFGVGLQGVVGEVIGDPIMFDTTVTMLALVAVWAVERAGDGVWNWGKKDAKALVK